jgi:hypothetical protein
MLKMFFLGLAYIQTTDWVINLIDMATWNPGKKFLADEKGIKALSSTNIKTKNRIPTGYSLSIRSPFVDGHDLNGNILVISKRPCNRATSVVGEKLKRLTSPLRRTHPCAFF